MREGTSRQAILDKSQKAGKRLSETGAACYLIGLDIQDAFAANGYDLLTTVLGPLIELECTAESHLFRPATASSLSLIEEARQCGRGDLLDLAQLDPAKLEFEKYQDGLYFKSELRDVGGVAALYYTDEFQFVPNPFSSNNIEPIYRRFPRQLTPFALPSTRD